MSVITVRPGDSVTIIGMPAYTPGLGPSHPSAMPGDPWFGTSDRPPQPNWPAHPAFPIYGPGIPTQPVDPSWGVGGGTPPTEPPPTNPPPQGTGHYVWAWSDQLQRWVWVKVPGPGEAGPKAAEPVKK